MLKAQTNTFPAWGKCWYWHVNTCNKIAGYLVDGTTGAVIATTGIFPPSFL
jgi:hypothetical protein